MLAASTSFLKRPRKDGSMWWQGQTHSAKANNRKAKICKCHDATKLATDITGRAPRRTNRCVRSGSSVAPWATAAASADGDGTGPFMTPSTNGTQMVVTGPNGSPKTGVVSSKQEEEQSEGDAHTTTNRLTTGARAAELTVMGLNHS